MICMAAEAWVTIAATGIAIGAERSRPPGRTRSEARSPTVARSGATEEVFELKASCQGARGRPSPDEVSGEEIGQ